jgi:uncharacterized protein (DUF342 family)
MPEANSNAVAETPHQVKQIMGDIGSAGGDIDFHGDLKVCGAILDGMNVQVDGLIEVGGGIAAADIRASGPINVGAGIQSRNRGKCITGKSLRCKFANAAFIEAADSVTASTEIVNSRVIAGGTIECTNGSIYGGRITANGGVKCQSLGSPNSSPTLIEAGIDERLRRLGETRAKEINENVRRIASVRARIAPLLANQKSLTPQQKEATTELLYDSNELEEKTENMVRDLRRLVAAIHARRSPRVLVADMVYVGVTIRFEGVETKITSPIQGPILFSLKSLGNSPQIVTSKPDETKTTPFRFSAVADPALAALYLAISNRNTSRHAAA